MNQDERTTAMQKKLLAWFEKVGRDLPWRKTHDPYKVAVSEIMLQQTQVDRVIPKYLNWLAIFPTWEALAKASAAEVLRNWSGLGYNRRALMLQRLSQAVTERKSFPDDPKEMTDLPGIGPYTSQAIAAFAFKRPGAAPIDTNIDRVLRRVFGMRGATAKEIEQLARDVVPPDSWSWNHALMDLGAMKCTARRPQCETCPLKDICLAYPCEGDDIVKVKQKKFEGSDRMYRGRILKELHKSSVLRRNDIGIKIGLITPPGLPFIEGKKSPDAEERLAHILEGMIKDGFIEITPQGEIRIKEEGK